MKFRLPVLLVLVGWGSQALAQTPTVLKDEKQKVSYSYGMNIGRFMKSQEMDLDLDLLLQGIKDTLGGKKTLLTDTEAANVGRTYMTELRNKQMERRRQLGEKNKVEGPAFLAANKSKPGVTTLPSGLQYKVLKPGAGEQPKTNDVVKVNYRGTLIDGTEFDSSYTRGPFTTHLNQVIKGWTEALQLMKVGAKWELYVPTELAYGEMGRNNIPPNAPLIFDIELLEIQHPPPVAALPPSPQPPVVTSDIVKVPSKAEMDKGAKIEIIKKEDLEKKK